jgi:hypothetical protein
MKRKFHTPKQIVNKLREADAAINSGGTIEQVCGQLRNSFCHVKRCVCASVINHYDLQIPGNKATLAKIPKENGNFGADCVNKWYNNLS